jgi:hypothetical protein
MKLRFGAESLIAARLSCAQRQARFGRIASHPFENNHARTGHTQFPDARERQRQGKPVGKSLLWQQPDYWVRAIRKPLRCGFAGQVYLSLPPTEWGPVKYEIVVRQQLTKEPNAWATNFPMGTNRDAIGLSLLCWRRHVLISAAKAVSPLNGFVQLFLLYDTKGI